MTREKVIKGLECCWSADDKCYECPYMTGVKQIGTLNGEMEYVCECDKLSLCKDALALLKAQEPVEPIQGRDDHDEDIFCCGVCGAVVGETYIGPPGEYEVRDNYCPECGRAVKWQ